MFYIEKNCYSEILSFFSDLSEEKCGLIAATDYINTVSVFSPIKSDYSDRKLCIPDSSEMNKIISQWADCGICFCGIIHSHTGECKMLSKEDKAYAEMQLSAYAHMPFLLFPIVLKERKMHKLHLYKCNLRNGIFNSEEIEYLIV